MTNNEQIIEYITDEIDKKYLDAIIRYDNNWIRVNGIKSTKIEQDEEIEIISMIKLINMDKNKIVLSLEIFYDSELTGKIISLVNAKFTGSKAINNLLDEVFKTYGKYI